MTLYPKGKLELLTIVHERQTSPLHFSTYVKFKKLHSKMPCHKCIEVLLVLPREFHYSLFLIFKFQSPNRRKDESGRRGKEMMLLTLLSTVLHTPMTQNQAWEIKPTSDWLYEHQILAKVKFIWHYHLTD